MTPLDNFTHPENADKYEKPKEEKPSTINDAILELKTMQIELDYSIKT
jgi:hypothetical protein